MRGVVAIGEDAALVEAAFQGICEIRSAQTMKQAVEQAAAMAKMVMLFFVSGVYEL